MKMRGQSMYHRRAQDMAHGEHDIGARACLQLGGLCMRTDQNQTRNIVLFAAPPVRRGFPNQLSSD